MIKLNISFLEILKNIILTNKKTKYFYNVTYTHSKYSLDVILKEILYVLKTGLSWRDVRSDVHWNSLYWHFSRLVKHNIFYKLFLCLRKGYIDKHNTTTQIVDSTFIMNKFGKSKMARNKFFKNKNCNKVSFFTDVSGIPLSVLVNNGNVHDLSFVTNHANDLMVLNKKIIKPVTLLADKGYVSSKLKEHLKSLNYNLIYPQKKNMKIDFTFDKTLYKKRIYIEHSFQKLKLFKRLQLRFDSTIETFKSFIFLAVSQIIFRKLND